MPIYQKPEEYFRETKMAGETIFQGRVLHVCRDTVCLPDGETSIREYCKHNGGVCVLPLTQSNTVICVRQYRYALGRVVLELPAGKFDFIGEDPMSAARRELEEETGYRCHQLISLGKLNPSPALLTETIHMYMATGLTAGQPNPDEGEYLEIVEIPLDTLVDMVLSGQIMDAKTQTAILKAWIMTQKT